MDRFIHQETNKEKEVVPPLDSEESRKEHEDERKGEAANLTLKESSQKPL
jgi:hypothetical protein